MYSNGYRGFKNLTITNLVSGSIIASSIMAYEENSLSLIDPFSIQTSLEKGNMSILPVEKDKIIVIKLDPSISNF